MLTPERSSHCSRRAAREAAIWEAICDTPADINAVVEASESLASFRSDPSLKLELHPADRQKDEFEREAVPTAQDRADRDITERRPGLAVGYCVRRHVRLVSVEFRTTVSCPSASDDMNVPEALAPADAASGRLSNRRYGDFCAKRRPLTRRTSLMTLTPASV
jgi:hypothetical protein